jgi:exopolysaccharide production repressor protein
MFSTLIVFAIASYFINGSFITTFFETIGAAILLQVGYFAVVLFMVWQAAETRHSFLESEQPTRTGLPSDDMSRPAVGFEQSPPIGS